MSSSQIELNAEELRKYKIMICTPMFGGSCFGTYTQSMNDLCTLFASNGIEMQTFFLFNESLIQRARNYCADEFLRSDCSHLMFIDADVAFNPLNVLQLLALQTREPDKYEIIAGPYPKKSINWQKIAAAVSNGLVNKNEPTQLQYFGGEVVMNFIPGTTEFRMDEPIGVLEAGTGFMLIPRTSFERFKNTYPEMEYKPDHLNTDNFKGDQMIHAFFHCEIDPDTKRYLSEDYFFCKKIIEMGGKIHLCPWMELPHTGIHTYRGSITASIILDKTIKENASKKIDKRHKKR